jgi:hypothetical protein
MILLGRSVYLVEDGEASIRSGQGSCGGSGGQEGNAEGCKLGEAESDHLEDVEVVFLSEGLEE